MIKKIIKYTKEHGFISLFKKLLKMIFFIRKATFWYRNLNEPIEQNTSNNSVLFCQAVNMDIKKIIDVWPKELGLISNENLYKIIKDKFDQGIPCFIVKAMDSKEVFGAVWCKPYSHDVPVIDNTQFPRKRSFEINNLFITQQARGMGLSTQLLNYALKKMRDDKKMIVSYSRIYSGRTASMIAHKKVGFIEHGTHIVGYKFGVKINTIIRTE